MKLWGEVTQELLDFFSKFLTFLQDDCVLASYLFSHSSLNTVLEAHEEEEFLSRFIHFMDCLKSILSKCETLQQTTKTADTNDISFDTEIANWPLDKDAAGIHLDEKTPHSNWSEFGDISNDNAQSHQSKGEDDANALSEIHMIVMASPASETVEKQDHHNSNDDIEDSNREIKISNDKDKNLNNNPKVSPEKNVRKFVRLPDGTFRCPVCDKCMSSHSAAVRHFRTHTGEKPFSCEYCLNKFASKTSLDSHLLRQHNVNAESALACQECGKLFVRRSALEVHLNTHKENKPFSCNICSKSFSQKVTLDAHLARHTGRLEYSCNLCDKKFVSRSKLNEHMHQHRNPRFQCDECGKQFVRQDSLRTHYRVHTGQRPYQCTICHKSFHTSSSLVIHKQTHTDGMNYKCEQCGAKFKHQSSLSSHMKKHTLSSWLPCPIAGCVRSLKGFLNGRSLQAHLRNFHQRYLCASCGREFGSKQSLLEHEKLHGNQVSTEETKPHSCHFCSRRFGHKSKLNAHIKTHMQEPAYACDMCGKRFHRKDVYSNHMFLHTGQKPFSCAHCGKAFAFKSNLSIHLTTHPSDGGRQQGEFPCPECNKKFRHRSSLKIHRKVHSGQFNHICETCGKKFVKKSHYEGHLRSHDSQRPFQCPTCGKGYKERKHCREHVRRLHGNDFNLETLFASVTSEDAQVADMLCSDQTDQHQLVISTSIVPSPNLNLFPNLYPIMQEVTHPTQFLISSVDVVQGTSMCLTNSATPTLAVLSSEETTSVLSQGLEP